MKKTIWIDERDALALHGRLLSLDGGPAGVRDPGLLESALARPRQLQAYGDNPGVADLAAAYDAMQGADSDDPACAGRPVDLPD